MQSLDRYAQRPIHLRSAAFTAFIDHLAGLLESGIPLIDALSLLAGSAEQANGRVSSLVSARPFRSAEGRVAHALHRYLAAGHSFLDALQRTLGHRPDLIDPTLAAFVRQSERTGALAGALSRAVRIRERRDTQRAALRQALAYPLFVCCAGLTLAGMLLTWTVPTFAQLFDQFDAALPPLTLTLLWLSERLRSGGPLIGCGVACVFATSVLRHVIRQHGGALSGRHVPPKVSALSTAIARLGRYATHGADRLPVVGALRRDARFALWGAHIASLLDAGVPLVEAVETMASMASETTMLATAAYGRARSLARSPAPARGRTCAGNAAPGSKSPREASRRVRECASVAPLARQLAATLRLGQPLSTAMRLSGAFHTEAIQITALAERTGKLAPMLHAQAVRCDIRVQARLQRLLRWVEPVAIVGCGALIGLLVLGLYLPIIQLGDVL